MVPTILPGRAVQKVQRVGATYIDNQPLLFRNIKMKYM